MTATHARQSALAALNHCGVCFILIWIQEDTDDYVWILLQQCIFPHKMESKRESEGGRERERRRNKVLLERNDRKLPTAGMMHCSFNKKL